MSARQEIFDRSLSDRAATIIDRAVLIVSFNKTFCDRESMKVGEIADAFQGINLSRPNVTILKRSLRADQRVSARDGVVRALKPGVGFLNDTFPELLSDEIPQPTRLSEEKRVQLALTPLIQVSDVDDLQKMLDLYASLHVLENSMRKLVAFVLQEEFGEDWWDKSSSAPQKRKHLDRLEKEENRRWLASRSSIGPLYSLDWADLVSIMRKYEQYFLKYVGEIDFLHRFSDLGLLRHVVAHHGMIENKADFDRVALALYDWQQQVGKALLSE